MSFYNHAYPMRLSLGTSPGMAISVAGVHLLVLGCTLFLQVPDLFVGALSLLVFLSYLRMYDEVCKRVDLLWTVEGCWSGCIDGQLFENATLLVSSVSTRYAVFLHLKMPDRAVVNVVVARDSLPEDQFRRLRVRLQIDGTVRSQSVVEHQV